MSLAPGTRLGPYEITAVIGAGGMGTVYRALDRRLDRTVAIKVLPEHIAADPASRERFEREGRAISRLNHPNICTLYDVGREGGVDFLVMEYLEGDTLAARLSKGPLPLQQALEIGLAICEALARAHHDGIVHRDVKPGNVMLTRSGAKLLDFGLAKPIGVPATASPSGIATMESPLTAEGSLVGTLHYMAPEQVEGKHVDARADIFAFGAVLYEMITGRRAFEGSTAASTIAAILDHHPPPVSKVQPVAPAGLDWIIELCLAKEPDKRWQSASDLSHALRAVARTASAPISSAHVTRGRVRAIAGVGALLLVGAAAAGTAWLFSSGPAARTAVKFELPPPTGTTVAPGPAAPQMAISPDGTRLAFSALEPSGELRLWLRRLDSLQAQPVPGTEGGQHPFWAPDGTAIAFFAFDGKLKKVVPGGGAPQTICDLPGIDPWAGGTWSPDGTILFSSGTNRQRVIYRVPAAGGTPVQATGLDPARGQIHHLWPEFLPDGRHFIFLAQSVAPETSGIYVGSLDSPDVERLIDADVRAAYSASGHLLFIRDGTLMAVRFDPAARRMSGDAFPVVDDINHNPETGLGRASFAVSSAGVLVYRTGGGVFGGLPTMQLTWFDRSGRAIGKVGQPGQYASFCLSPDGTRVVVEAMDTRAETYDLWMLDAPGRTTRLTFAAGSEDTPVCSRDGGRIIYSASGSNGAASRALLYTSNPTTVYEKALAGGADEPLLESDTTIIIDDWSADGRFIVYETASPKTGFDVWILPLNDRKPFAFLQSAADEDHAQFSPNGRWMSYTSNESGSPQVYVESFPTRGTRRQISTSGGTEARWRRDGRELFYLSNDRKLMAVDISEGTTLEAGTPRALFQTRVSGLGLPNEYAVSADGQRFLLKNLAEEFTGIPITVIVNWTSLLPSR